LEEVNDKWTEDGYDFGISDSAVADAVAVIFGIKDED
jgi:hypothetical protein